MARYKKIDYDQNYFVPIDFKNQILPGSFEYTLNNLIDNNIDLSSFDDLYNNDQIGATAYLPSLLLKIILFGYYKGVFTSRKIAELCRSNTIFIALSCWTSPDFTTIASFVSTMGK